MHRRQDWCGLFDLLAGSGLSLLTSRVHPIQTLISSSLELSPGAGEKAASHNTPIINITDQLHERLRSCPTGLALVTPEKLVTISDVITSLVTR